MAFDDEAPGTEQSAWARARRRRRAESAMQHDDEPAGNGAASASPARACRSSTSSPRARVRPRARPRTTTSGTPTGSIRRAAPTRSSSSTPTSRSAATQILRGLNMGLPEGMVSMILGPSGTGKSVCIKHMVGLLYPDEGDVLVHGESVPNMPDDQLFEMRKKFGLLFQDGALFGSMNLYDNVAFPLRQHTEKGEDEIEDIVMRRLHGGRPRRRARARRPTSSPAGCASAPGSRGRSCSSPTSCCSTSPTRASIRCARRCSAS